MIRCAVCGTVQRFPQPDDAVRRRRIEAARLTLRYAAQTECEGCNVCDAAREIIATFDQKQEALR